MRTLAVLGDSTSVGIGDPAPGGGWRGFAPMLASALGASTLTNIAKAGARMRAVRADQVPRAVAARPDAAVIVVGMNDTLRSDFDPFAMHADGVAAASALRAAGAHVLLVRFHDHTKVFRMPVRLQRALRRRISAVNAVIDAIAATDPAGISVLDLDVLPGGYERSAWAIDRLHPSELGHRLLAHGFAGLLSAAGYDVPGSVGLTCGGGREVGGAQRAAWLVVKGLPWLVRRSHDLGPAMVQGLWEERAGRVGRAPAWVAEGAFAPDLACAD